MESATVNTWGFRTHRQSHLNSLKSSITVSRQVGEALVLALLPFAVTHVEVNVDWAGYPLVSVRWDLHNNRVLKYKQITDKIIHDNEIRQNHMFTV